MAEATWLNDYVLTVTGFLTAAECEKLIQISEDFGYEPALVSSEKGHVIATDIRNNERVMFRDEQLSDWLWERSIDFAPNEYEGRAAVGLNEMLRFYRYDPGQRFDWHQDFAYERENGDRSYLTFMVYLNADFTGGETSFEDSYSDEAFDELTIKPEPGMALFFDHATHHKGEEVLSGRKYVLRTDVMYASEADDSEVEEIW